MKAAVCTKYGPPEALVLKQVNKPKPKANEIGIKVYAAGVTASDIFIRSSNMPLRYKIPLRLFMGITKPRKPILGLVFSGIVESLGKNTSLYKVGDRVYGLTGFSMGAYAEYVCLKETNSTLGCMAINPEGISHEEATVAAYGGSLALQYLEKGKVQPGDKVLIYGASGTSGTIAVQMAKYYGAHVTAVCSTANVAMVKSLGAENVIDYTKVDTLPKNDAYNFILDAVGRMKSSKLKENCKKALLPHGKYVSIDDGDLKLSTDRLVEIKRLIELKIFKPVLDCIYDFDQIVDAHAYVEKGHKKGGVAIRVAG